MTPELAEQIATQRAAFAPLIVEPEGVTLEPGECSGVPVEWTVPASGLTAPGLVIVYLHGGGYSSGLAKWTRATARLALGTGGRVVPRARDDVGELWRRGSRGGHRRRGDVHLCAGARVLRAAPRSIAGLPANSRPATHA